MIDGLEEIRAAAEALATRDEKLKERLRRAGREFWSATYFKDDWPAELRERAADLQRALLEHGSVKETVAKMSRDQAEDTAENILYLLVEFEKATGSKVVLDAPDDPSPTV
jgi:Lon protease-like protein